MAGRDPTPDAQHRVRSDRGRRDPGNDNFCHLLATASRSPAAGWLFQRRDTHLSGLFHPRELYDKPTMEAPK